MYIPFTYCLVLSVVLGVVITLTIRRFIQAKEGIWLTILLVLTIISLIYMMVDLGLFAR